MAMGEDALVKDYPLKLQCEVNHFHIYTTLWSQFGGKKLRKFITAYYRVSLITSLVSGIPHDNNQ